MKSKKEKQRSIFDVCFPCFSKTIHCDDIVCSSAGKDFTDYEFVIENLAIRRAPKKLLEEHKVCKAFCSKKKKAYPVKKAPPEISIGPVTQVTDASPEEMLESRKCKFCGPCVPNYPVSNAEEMDAPSSKKPGTTTKNFYVETETGLDDNIIRQILNPHLTIYDKTGKMQVSADVHRTEKEEDANKSTKIMPTEIKETIEALKVAKPHTSDFSPRNRRSLIRTVSTTSCDKETSCNFFDLKYYMDNNSYARDFEAHLVKEEVLQKSPKATRKWPAPPKKFKSSSSTSEATPPFPDIIECEEKESCDLQTENSGTSGKPQKGQSLKWKIIINKHKKDKKN